MLAAAQAPVAVKITAPEEVDASNFAAELATARAAQLEAERELQALRTSHPAIVAAAVEDQTNELDLLRNSLATLASELEVEKTRVAEEEDKVHTLRLKMEDSRRALMRVQGEAQRRSSIDMHAPLPPRRASTIDTLPRRRSSLGPPLQGLPSAIPVPNSSVGLGLAVDSPKMTAMSTSPSGKPSPLHRFAHRRGSTNLCLPMETREEDDRAAKLRDLRLGFTTTKVASRGSLANGLPDFFGLADFEFDADRKNAPGSNFGRHGSIGQDPFERPPSAPLRLGGRNNSVAVFENWSRRSSTSSCGSYSFPSFTSGSAISSTSSADVDDRLLMQLEGLRIQLAESEESRRASEHCVKVLKDFITAHPDANISLPPLPSDAEPPHRPTSGSRWSIPRLSLGGGSRSSSPAQNSSPNLTTYTRRTSNTSNSSMSTSIPPLATPTARSGAPTFGAFSFSALVARSSSMVDGDTSPTMSGPSGKTGTFQSTFPLDPSPQLQNSANFSPPRGSSSAPSLTSGSSSSPSTDDEDDDDELDFDAEEPEVVFSASRELFSYSASAKGYVKDAGSRPLSMVSGSGLGLGL